MLADAAVSSANFWIMAVSAISAAVALVIGYTTARSIQKPLQKLITSWLIWLEAI